MSAGNPCPSAFLLHSRSPCPAGSSLSAPRRMLCCLAPTLGRTVLASYSSSVHSAAGACSGRSPGPSRMGLPAPAGTAGSAACLSAMSLAPVLLSCCGALRCGLAILPNWSLAAAQGTLSSCRRRRHALVRA
eukprot:570822-Heterocapsa_arctica.AAC.1